MQTGGCNRKVELDAAALTEAGSRAAGTAERLIADASWQLIDGTAGGNESGGRQRVERTVELRIGSR